MSTAEAAGTSPRPPESDGELPRAVVITTMACVMGALLLAALDSTIVGTAMPRVIAELKGLEHYAAVTTVYMLASTVVLPIAGKLSDTFGRKVFLVAGVALFVLASGLCGAAETMTQLIVFRGIQGLGAGLTQAMAFTTIADLFPPARRGKVSGMMGAVWGLSSIIGPAVGGALTDGPGWRWCFLINVPVGVVVLVGLVLVFPSKRLIDAGPATERKHIDWFGALTLVAFAVPILLALSWGGREYAWGSPTIVGMLTGGGAMLVAFVFAELRAPEPIIPFKMFKDRVVWTSSVAATLVSVALFGAAMFIPLFLQAVVGASAIKSGAAMTPLMLSMITSSILAGQVMTRTQRYKVLALFGVTTVTLALVLFAWMDVSTSYGVTVRNMIVLGVGLGCTMPVFNLAVQNAVSPRDVGVATSSLQFLRSMGGSLGGAIFGALLTARLAAHHVGMRPDQLVGLPLEARTALADGLHVVYVVAAAVMACGIVAGLLLEDRPLRKSNRVVTPAAEAA